MDVRISAQCCGEAVDVGIGSFFHDYGFIVAVRRHLVGPEIMMVPERWEAAGLVGIGVGIVGDVVVQVNKDHHDAM